MKAFFISILALLFMGCATLGPNEKWEKMLNMVKTPVTVVSVSTSAPCYVMFMDAKGRYFSIMGNYLQSLAVGDVLY